MTQHVAQVRAEDRIGEHSQPPTNWNCHPADLASQIELLVPDGDAECPEVSIVVPASNEAITIGEFVRWCMIGIERAGVAGEVLIVDSSTDDTPRIALAEGARVLRTPKRGLGRAYIDALPYVRGRYVIMGDADCTYDFRELAPFLDALRSGADFAMGSRWLGSIEPGSMPMLHRYVGTPITTRILNAVYGSTFTDIHCGMRGITRDALVRMGLASQSWEYASEMVLKSVRMEMPTTEVPVRFYKDRNGRQSHHKRASWTSPFRAAWTNMREMFVYRADYFMLKPGIVLLILGLLLTAPLTAGNISIASFTFGLYWMLVGVALSIIGLQSFFFGCLAQVFCEYSPKARERWAYTFRYTRTVLISGALLLAGFAADLVLFIWYITHHLRLPPASSFTDHLAVAGLLLMIMGFSTFCFTLLLHATGVRYGGPSNTDTT